MKKCIRLVLFLSLLFPVYLLASECEGGGEEVLVRISAEYKEGQNTSTVSWPLLQAFADPERICVINDDIEVAYMAISTTEQTLDALLVPRSDMVIAVSSEASMQTTWKVAVAGVAGLPEYQENGKDFKPSCFMQMLQINKLLKDELTDRLGLAVDAQSQPFSSCQGEKQLKNISLPGQWQFNVAVFALTETMVKDKSLGEKASWFFKSHPVDDDAKKRLKKR